RIGTGAGTIWRRRSYTRTSWLPEPTGGAATDPPFEGEKKTPGHARPKNGTNASQTRVSLISPNINVNVQNTIANRLTLLCSRSFERTPMKQRIGIARMMQ